MYYSRAQRVLYARRLRIAEDRIALKYRKPLAQEIKRATTEFASAYRYNGAKGFKSVREAHENRLRKILEDLGDETARKFAKVPFNGVKARPKFETDFEDAVYQSVAEGAARQVTNISGTTEESIRKTIADGLAAQLTNAQIAENISAIANGPISASRAATIARTEVHTAANAAQFEMVEAVGVKMNREWLSTNDDRVREDHDEADGQVVGPGDDFDVGGETLRYPGDPDGSPHNIINCRCTVAYIEADEE